MKDQMLIVSLILFCFTMTSLADWPCWRGINRDGICTEENLLQEWPDDGPPLAWQMKGIGKGYSSVAIVGNRLYTMGDLELEGKTDDKGKPVKKQYVMGVDLSSREILWKTEVGAPHRDGSRCTPTVDEGRVYILGTSADLVCVQASKLDEFVALCERQRLPVVRLGEVVRKPELEVLGQFSLPLGKIEQAWRAPIPAAMG